jgi:hypothetical protein
MTGGAGGGFEREAPICNSFCSQTSGAGPITLYLALAAVAVAIQEGVSPWLSML